MFFNTSHTLHDVFSFILRVIFMAFLPFHLNSHRGIKTGGGREMSRGRQRGCLWDRHWKTTDWENDYSWKEEEAEGEVIAKRKDCNQQKREEIKTEGKRGKVKQRPPQESCFLIIIIIIIIAIIIRFMSLSFRVLGDHPDDDDGDEGWRVKGQSKV